MLLPAMIIDSKFVVPWENYRNTLLITNTEGLNRISTRIYKDSDIIIQPAAYDGNDDGSSSYYVSNEDRMTQQHITSFETAGNTNARTYSVYWRVSSGTAYMNRYSGSDSYNGVSILRVTEVAA